MNPTLKASDRPPHEFQQKLVLYPDTIPKEWANITISWKGIIGPTIEDWIGIFTPIESNRVYTSIWANVSKSWKKGQGEVHALLLNMREDYIVRYMRGNGDKAQIITISNVLKVNPEYPMQGHLSYTHDPTEMRVMWVSGRDSQPTVQYGLDPNHLNLVATGASHTYFETDLCTPKNKSHYWFGSHWWWDPGYIHNVLLKSLTPNTRYYYKFGSDSTLYSDIFSFNSHVGFGEDAASSIGGVKVIAFGDMGTRYCGGGWWCPGAAGLTSDSLLNELSNGIYAMVLHIGDISYALNHALTWEEWFAEIEPIATQVPWMVGIGNHEYDHYHQPFRPKWSNYGNDSNGECGVPYRNRFHMPTPTLEAQKVEQKQPQVIAKEIDTAWWYSFDYGNAHFVVMSTEHDFLPGSVQYQWMDQDLSAVNRTITPWVILGGHRPMYCSGNYTSDYQMAVQIQIHLEDLLYRHEVDLCLWGHYHSYERSCPVYNNKCVTKSFKKNGYLAPVHTVIGMAGAALSNDWIKPQPEWSLFRDALRYGYSVIHIHNNTALEFKYIEDTTATVMDVFWLFK